MLFKDQFNQGAKQLLPCQPFILPQDRHCSLQMFWSARQQQQAVAAQ